MKSNRPPIEDFFSGKHHVAALATAAGIDFPRQPLTPSAAPFFGWQEGHSASAGNIEHGWTARFGLLNLSMVKSLGIEGKVYAGLFAILPEKLSTDVNRRRFSDFGLFPAALRNLGLVVPTATPAVDVQKALAKAARAVVGNAFALEIVGVFDVYPGKGLPEGTKSRAFSLVFRAADRTLSDDEVNAVFTKTQQSIVADGKIAVRTQAADGAGRRKVLLTLPAGGDLPACTMPNPPATLQDIAARLGVHPSTVSRGLRNHPAISEAVRLRVQAVAREFAYKPNPLIAALVRSRKARRAGSYRANLGYVYTAPVGRVTAWRKDYDALFSGARTRARFLGYELEEFNLSGTRFTPRRFTQILLTRNILGLILPPLYSTQDALPVDWEHFGVISIGHSHAIPANRVVHNHFTAIRTALAACRQRGRQRIGFVVPRRLHEKVGKLWLAGYVVDQFEHGGRRAQVPPLLIENEAGHAEFAAWLRRHRPDAIVGLLNLTPLAQWVKAAGLAGEVELVTLDHGAADGGFGGIFHDHPRIGATAVDQLVSLLERNERGLPAHPTGIYIEGRWVEAVAAAAAKTAS